MRGLQNGYRPKNGLGVRYQSSVRFKYAKTDPCEAYQQDQAVDDSVEGLRQGCLSNVSRG